MPFMERYAEQSQQQDKPLMQARRELCKVLRKKLHAIRTEREEQICLEALEYVESGEVSYYVRYQLVGNVQTVRDPDLLRIVALDAPDRHIQIAAIWSLFYMGQTIERNTQAVLRELSQTSASSEVANLASELLNTDATLSTGEVALAEPTDLRKSILNPQLPALCTYGYLDPDDLLDRELIECLVFAGGYSKLKYLLPDDRQDERIERWWEHHGAYRLIERETDIDALESFVLHGYDDEMRAVSFSRLTSWWHWEKCDSFSHVTYSCEPLESYDDERAIRLCEQILSTTEPYMPWHDPTPPLDALREGAREVTEKVLYGGVFMNDVTFVGERARKAASELGQSESVEHWLWGCMQFCEVSDHELSYGDYPYLSVIDACEDRQQCREELARRNIDAKKLASALWHALLCNPVGSTSSPTEYLNAALRATRHREAWDVTVCDLLKVILHFPTESICVALNRLALLDALHQVTAVDSSARTRDPHIPPRIAPTHDKGHRQATARSHPLVR